MIALLLSAHPVPAAAVTVVGMVLALATGLGPAHVVLLTLVVGVDQLSVGWSNDWIDASRDRATGRTDKPVARGAISPAVVRNTAFAALALSIGGGFLLGPAAGIAHAVFVLSAWAYNAGLKATPLSVLPYIVSFGLLPAIATLAASPPALPQWWATTAGALLGVAAHFANVLPDLEDDRRTGVRGLPHRLGLRGAGITAFAVLVAGSAGVAIGVPGPLALGGTAVVLLIAVLGVRLVLRRRVTRLLFGLVLLSALVLVVLLAAGGSSLAVRLA